MSNAFNPYKMFNGIFIPDGVYNCTEISGLSKLVYGRLLRYAGKNGVAHPKQETIANELSASKNGISKAIKNLVDVGLIKIEKGNPIKHESNKYFFLQSEILGINKKYDSRSALCNSPESHSVGFLHIEESHIEESHNKNGKPSFPYKEIFEYYISFKNLKSHRTLTEEMKKAVDKFIKSTSATVDDIKIVIQRHSTVVTSTEKSEYPVRARSIQELFGQKVFQGSHLIGSEYLDDGKYGTSYKVVKEKAKIKTGFMF